MEGGCLYPGRGCWLAQVLTLMRKEFLPDAQA